MDIERRLKNLAVPGGRADVVLDTDAYNEIDDQFAIAYLLKSKEKLDVKAIYAAPFHNARSESPGDGMEKSYEEILKLLSLADETADVFRGSDRYLPDEATPVVSDAARDLAERAKRYSPQKPLYVVAIGAITNIASAILLNPAVAENTVVVWLGGHAHHFCDNREFNMFQDVAAARVVMGSGVPFVQLPCEGVVRSFTLSKPELEKWFIGKNELATYLAENSIAEAETYATERSWTRVIWDVTAVAWLLNDDGKFMEDKLISSPIPEYDMQYAVNTNRHFIKYVHRINRDALFEDLFEKLKKGI